MSDIRKKIFLAAYSGGIGHLASAFSLVEILQTLYIDGVMKHNAENPNWDGRDILILSKGHGSLALYTILAKAGYFEEKELYTFVQPGTFLGGEPNTHECPGVEASTGSLGHGLSIGLGMALALKSENKTNRVYVILGDGECQEGCIWEAVMSAQAFKLDNLTVIIDNNHIQKMDFVEKIMGSENLGRQFETFGWDVKVCEGHNRDELKQALTGSWQANKPRCLIAQTIKGKGVSLMENNPSWHWRMPGRKEMKIFLSELGISQNEIDSVKGEL